MTVALQLVNALISMMALADKLGLNVASVKAVFDNAKAQGRDVTREEIEQIANDAQAASNRLDALISQLPETDD